MLQHAVDDAGAVEPADDGGTSGDRRGLEVLDFLQPADEQLHVHPLNRQRRQVAILAPTQPAAKVAVVVYPGPALVPGQVGSGRKPHRIDEFR